MCGAVCHPQLARLIAIGEYVISASSTECRNVVSYQSPLVAPDNVPRGFDLILALT
jgi:hypothetical protein